MAPAPILAKDGDVFTPKAAGTLREQFLSEPGLTTIAQTSALLTLAATQAHFVAGLLRGLEHETSGAETLKTMEVVWAGYRSAEEGRTIEL